MVELTMRLEKSWEIAPQVKQFVLVSEDAAPFSFLPGQFVTFHFEVEGKAYKRSYSIANPPTASGQIEFAASYVDNGVGSQFLFNLQPGAFLKMSGPYGRLVLKEPLPKRYIFVGTGTGVTPYRAMRPQLEQKLALDATLEVVLVQGARTRVELLYADEFMDWSRQSAQVTYLGCLSRHSDGKLAPEERVGHVQQGLSELVLDPNQDVVYLCGNPNMIDEVFASLTQQGFHVSRVIREKYLSR
ncbi:MAG: FAD-binding oxidoreductase [Gammaproteobacteria bacterium]|nr:FAD-binding oxidoreductase [Gammaproteobacteria bacterium]